MKSFGHHGNYMASHAQHLRDAAAVAKAEGESLMAEAQVPAVPKVVKVNFRQTPEDNRWGYVFLAPAPAEDAKDLREVFWVGGFDDFTHAAAEAVEALARMKKEGKAL